MTLEALPFPVSTLKRGRKRKLETPSGGNSQRAVLPRPKVECQFRVNVSTIMLYRNKIRINTSYTGEKRRDCFRNGNGNPYGNGNGNGNTLKLSGR